MAKKTNKELHISLIFSNFVVEIKNKSQDNLDKLNMRYYNSANEYNLIQKKPRSTFALLGFSIILAKAFNS